jgi:acyl carrier protein
MSQVTPQQVDQAEIVQRIAEHFQVSEQWIELQSSLVYDLGADSSDLLALCIRLSDLYGCELDTYQMVHLRTVGDLCTLVEEAVRRP